MSPAAVLGGGSWGTCLAWLLSSNRREVRQWVREASAAAEMQAARRNLRYLPEIEIPEGVTVTADLPAALHRAELVIAAVPSGALRSVLERARDSIPPGAVLLLATKGLELGTGSRVSEVAISVLGPGAWDRLAVLSGPNLAGEIVRRMPAATVIASTSAELAARLQAAASTPTFRAYTSTDVIGVELGGALKNPVALAAGISDGLGFGANTRAGLLTRGLAEITRLGAAAGARRETFSGLSGLGDLVATAHSPLSRNYRFGLALGRGRTPKEAAAEVRQTAEGVPTTAAGCLLAGRLGVEAPILEELRVALFENGPVDEAVRKLMARPPRAEEV